MTRMDRRKRSTLAGLMMAALAIGAAVGGCHATLSVPGMSGSSSGGPGGPPPNGPGGPAAANVPAGAHVEDLQDDRGRTYHIVNGAKGDPGVIGCADGQREAFADATAFPRIAGCLGSWDGTKSMRTPATGRACGDDLGPCAVPADLCAPGWHLCGSSGAVADLRQISGEQCERAGGGRFSAAISHCKAQDGCQYDGSAQANYSCFESGWCSEPVCCGGDCGEFGQCAGGVWDNKTHIPVGEDQGCGAMSSRRAGGVLCCR